MTRTTLLGEQLADAATSMIGAKFKLYGRAPSTGLDCIGLVAASLQNIGGKVFAPQGYRLRNVSVSQWHQCAEASGFGAVSGEIFRGDLLLLRSGPAQQHLVISDGARTIIHAHAGLRLVVREPLNRQANFSAHWRLTSLK